MESKYLLTLFTFSYLTPKPVLSELSEKIKKDVKEITQKSVLGILL